MKKLIPLLVVAAGAVAYNVYKNRKEAVKQEKTFVVIDDSNDTPDKSEPVKETFEQTVLDESANDVTVKETEPETVQTEEIVEEPVVADETEVDETKVDEFAEAMQEVQQELGIFETLSDMDETYGRPSFFHVTDDSFIEPEFEQPTEIVSTIIVEDDEDEVAEETPEAADEVAEEPVTIEDEATAPEVVEDVQEEILSTIVVDDTEEELDVEIELILEEQLDINEVVEFAEEVEETILSTILVEDENEPVEEAVLNEDQLLEETVDETVEEEVIEEPVSEESIAEEPFVEDEPIEVDALIEGIAEQIEEVIEEPVFINLNEKEEVELEPLQSYNTPEVDELMKTIAGQVKAADQTENEPEEVEEETADEVVEEVQPAEEGDYLQDIRKITELYSEKVAQYNIRFPYLSSRFIDDTLKFSNQFNTEYPIGTRVAIEHHVRFSEVEDLFVFAQIIRQSGYHVKEGTEDKTLIVVREMFVDNNTILHDVFKVANQVYCLSGEYQKFRITKR